MKMKYVIYVYVKALSWGGGVKGFNSHLNKSDRVNQSDNRTIR